MKTSGLFFALLIPGLFSGCVVTSSTICELDEGMRDYKTTEAYNVGRLEPNYDQIDVQLACPEVCGCYFLKVNDEVEKSEKGPWKCSGMPLNAENPKDEIKQKAIDADLKNKLAYIFTSFDDVAQEMLISSLSSYYKKVNIKKAGTKELPTSLINEVTMDFYMSTVRTGDKRMIVKMLVLDENNDLLFDITGSSVNGMGNAHLAWLIPVAVLTFPIGTIIGFAVLDNVERGMLIRTVMEAMDDASRQFAEKSLEFSANGLSQFKLMVLME